MRRQMSSPVRSSIGLWCVVAQAFAGNVSYQVTENPGACHEVHFGRLSKPEEILLDVSTGHCRPEIRSAGETVLYVAAACQLTVGFTKTFPISREKYAVDLVHPNRIRRIDETAWTAAVRVRPGGGGDPPRSQDRGIEDKGHILEKSGPRWAGVGPGPIDAKFSENG